MATDIEDLVQQIPDLGNKMMHMHSTLCAFPSWDASKGEVLVSMQNGRTETGDGGVKKANYVQGTLEELKFFDDIKRYDATDSNGNAVPILVARKTGVNVDGPTIWFAGHFDTVAPTVTTLDYEPLSAQVSLKHDKIMVEGLGTEDNNQAIVEMFYTAELLANNGVTPTNNMGFLYFGREELGSDDGGAVDWLKGPCLEEKIIKPGDAVIVPDAPGTGQDVYVQEGYIQQISVRFYRKETARRGEGMGTHVLGSKDHGYENPVVAMAEFIMYTTQEMEQQPGFEWLDKVADDADMYEGLAQTPRTTINPTTLPKNQDSVNNVPGEAVIRFDNRYIAEDGQHPEQVYNEFVVAANRIAEQYNVKASVTLDTAVEYYGATKRTDLAWTLTERALYDMGIKAIPRAVKAGTFGRFFNLVGASAVAVGFGDETEHNPGEYTKIINNMRGTDRNLRAVMCDLNTLAK